MDKKVLLVDDDPYLLDAMSVFLKSKGLNVLVTTDPEKALQIAEKEKPHLIITDIAMPGVNGFTLMRGLKSNKTTASTPLVLLTGSDKIEDVQEGFDSGAEAYLLKPVNWENAWPKLVALLNG